MIRNYEEIFEKFELTESRWNTMVQILKGVSPRISSIGIITAENPMGLQLSPSQNKERNKKLDNYLRSGNYGFHRIIGKYGIMENPFFIINAKLEMLKEIGDMYVQEAFIFGIKNEKYIPGDKSTLEIPAMTFEYWQKEEKKPENPYILLSTRFVYIEVGEEEKDFYSRYKGKKFIIPFFDDNYNATPEKKLIPERVSYERKDLKKESIELLEKYHIDNRIKEYLTEEDNYAGSHNYRNRGTINLIISKIRRIQGK